MIPDILQNGKQQQNPSIIIQFKIIHRLVETYGHLEKVHQFTRTWKTMPSNSIVPGEAQDEILELDTAMISGIDWVDKILERLNQLYKKDGLTEKYNAPESFETYKCNSNTLIHDFLTEFKKHYYKMKSHGTIWSDEQWPSG